MSRSSRSASRQSGSSWTARANIFSATSRSVCHERQTAQVQVGLRPIGRQLPALLDVPIGLLQRGGISRAGEVERIAEAAWYSPSSGYVSMALREVLERDVGTARAQRGLALLELELGAHRALPVLRSRLRACGGRLRRADSATRFVAVADRLVGGGDHAEDLLRHAVAPRRSRSRSGRGACAWRGSHRRCGSRSSLAVRATSSTRKASTPRMRSAIAVSSRAQSPLRLLGALLALRLGAGARRSVSSLRCERPRPVAPQLDELEHAQRVERAAQRLAASRERAEALAPVEPLEQRALRDRELDLLDTDRRGSRRARRADPRVPAR